MLFVGMQYVLIHTSTALHPQEEAPPTPLRFGCVPVVPSPHVSSFLPPAGKEARRVDLSAPWRALLVLIELQLQL